MRVLLQFAFLLVSACLPSARGAVVFMPLRDRELNFTYLDDSIHRIPLDFLPGEGRLWLTPYGFVSMTSWLISQGPVRIVTTIAPPPDIGGPVSALDPGSIVGPGLASPKGWYSGEPPFPDNGDRLHVLFEGMFFPVQSEFFKEEAYIGLEFEIDGQVHYGWLSVELEPGDYPWNSRPAASRITGFAYEDRPGVPIVTGVVPEPGIPLLMAVGSAAFCVRRSTPIRVPPGRQSPSNEIPSS